MPRKFAEMSSKFRFGQEFVEKLGISSNFVDRCLHYFCTILYMSLQNSLTEVVSNCQLNYNCCLLTIGINTGAVIKNSEQSSKIFDAHSRDLHGMPYSFEKCTMLTIEGIENRVSYLKISCLQIGVVPFEIKGVFVRDNELDLQNVHKSPKIEHLPFRNKRNQTQHMKRKQKSLTETPEEKEKQVIARHEYEK